MHHRLTRSELIDGLDNLQNRFAASLSGIFAAEHIVRVSVSISDWNGQVSDTLQPAQPRSSREWWWWKTDRGLFADGVVFTSHEQRIQAIYQVAQTFFEIVAESNPNSIVNATFQDTVGAVARDHVVQAYIQNGRLVLVEKEVED